MVENQKSDVVDFVTWGIVGILTFQVPFLVVTLPQIVQYYRLQPVHKELRLNHNGILNVMNWSCDNIDGIYSIPQCFNPEMFSSGACKNGTIEVVDAYGIEKDGTGKFLNSESIITHQANSEPSLIVTCRDWCRKERRWYDPKKANFPITDDRASVINIRTLLLIILIGGFFGILALYSLVFDLVLVVIVIGLPPFAVWIIGSKIYEYIANDTSVTQPSVDVPLEAVNIARPLEQVNIDPSEQVNIDPLLEGGESAPPPYKNFS